MPESRLEFTGERVVPGLVDPDLFNEHLARYRFAARFAGSARVLDAGCGSGYGAAELLKAASVTGFDISGEAVQHARRTFTRPHVHFLQAACEALPFAGASFDLVLAFEVIEHLAGWREMLAEARRVLGPAGTLLVSTPNKAWYTESRAAAGPNPYHVHEFEYAEFAAALRDVFAHVHLWTQNHSEAIAFIPASATSGALDAPADHSPETAHFFLAACSQSPIAETRAFAWLPSAGNLLRERLQHITLLESELEKKNGWLTETLESLATLEKEHEELQKAHDQSNAWANGLNGELEVARGAIARLEAETTDRLAWVRDRETHIRDLEGQTERARAEIARLNQELEEKEATVAERTEWAQSLDRELQDERARLQTLESAPLVRAGRRLRMLPLK